MDNRGRIDNHLGLARASVRREGGGGEGEIGVKLVRSRRGGRPCRGGKSSRKEKTAPWDKRSRERGVMNNGGGYERIRASFSRQRGGVRGYTRR